MVLSIVYVLNALTSNQLENIFPNTTITNMQQLSAIIERTCMKVGVEPPNLDHIQIPKGKDRWGFSIIYGTSLLIYQFTNHDLYDGQCCTLAARSRVRFLLVRDDALPIIRNAMRSLDSSVEDTTENWLNVMYALDFGERLDCHDIKR